MEQLKMTNGNLRNRWSNILTTRVVDSCVQADFKYNILSQVKISILKYV